VSSNDTVNWWKSWNTEITWCDSARIPAAALAQLNASKVTGQSLSLCVAQCCETALGCAGDQAGSNGPEADRGFLGSTGAVVEDAAFCFLPQLFQYSAIAFEKG